MNDFRPSLGIEFDDKYIDAKNKMNDFILALNKLTEAQRCQLEKEFITSASAFASLEQFAKYIKNGGRF